MPLEAAMNALVLAIAIAQYERWRVRMDLVSETLPWIELDSEEKDEWLDSVRWAVLPAIDSAGYQLVARANNDD